MKKLITAFLVLGCFMLQGCIGMRSNSLPRVAPEQVKFSAAEKTKVFSRWKLKTDAPTKEKMRVLTEAATKKNFDDVMVKSGCCVIVESPSDAQVVIDGTTHDHLNRAALVPAFLTGFTFGALPSWAKVEGHLTLEVSTNGKTSSYEARDSMTMVTWLPLVLGLPFANAITMAKELDANIANTLIVNMKKDGVLGS